MPAKGSTGGQSIEKIREREQARRDARKQPKPTTPKRVIRVTGYRTLVLTIPAHSSRERLQECYRRLDNLTTYFPKYRYHMRKQEAVMQGRVVLEDLPGKLYIDLLSIMTKGGNAWQQGGVS